MPRRRRSGFSTTATVTAVGPVTGVHPLPPSAAGKWSIGIVAAAAGPIRFTELEHAIEGISRRMLTLNLRKLKRDGLLVRTVYPTVPPKVEYRLTPIARELGESFATLTAWAERHHRAIAASRSEYDCRLGHGRANCRRTSMER